jgi:hypothetical protein
MQKFARRTLPVLLASALIYGCGATRHEQAYYVSPFNANTGGYHPLPLLRDSATNAFYAQADYFGGAANTNRNDNFKGGKTSIYWAHCSKVLQWYSGVDLSLGAYHVRSWDTGGFWNYNLPPRNYRQLDADTGRKFFGGTGFSTGINYVIPIGGGDEWRVLGVETTLYREFGDYQRFRAKLPDSLAALNVRDRFYGMAGLTTEVIGKLRDGDLGFRVAAGWVLGPRYNNLNLYDSIQGRLLEYKYFSFSFHYTTGRLTGYTQIDKGTKAVTGHLGFVYRLTPLRRQKK